MLCGGLGLRRELNLEQDLSLLRLELADSLGAAGHLWKEPHMHHFYERILGVLGVITIMIALLGVLWLAS